MDKGIDLSAGRQETKGKLEERKETSFKCHVENTHFKHKRAKYLLIFPFCTHRRVKDEGVNARRRVRKVGVHVGVHAPLLDRWCLFDFRGSKAFNQHRLINH